MISRGYPLQQQQQQQQQPATPTATTRTTTTTTTTTTFHFRRSCGSSRTLAGIGLLCMNGQPWDKFSKPETTRTKLGPRTKQAKLETAPQRASIASQQSAKNLSKTFAQSCFARQSVDSARGGPRTVHTHLFAKSSFKRITHRTCGLCSAAYKRHASGLPHQLGVLDLASKLGGYLTARQTTRRLGLGLTAESKKRAQR